jgi:hypothetical protein
MLSAWGKLREEREVARADAFNSERGRRAEKYAAAQMKYEAKIERKHRIRNLALSAAGMAMGGFVLLGLILAVLAVERHTRLLEAQIAPSKLVEALVSPESTNP